jgi:modification methylase
VETSHIIHIADSRDLSCIADGSIDLVVTSPPYPMIKMWDSLFSEASPEIHVSLNEEKGDTAFELMHLELDKVWRELYRTAKKGAFVCVNIGDATRSIGNGFQLYSNHARIIRAMKKIGFETLPIILWRKQTNAPNKFMGSGMLPAGAYVTLEHEYILIFRKGGKQKFTAEDAKLKRRRSAYFWEERNTWFSDLWDFKGASQLLKDKKTRERSAAYPFELAYRLIQMYSLRSNTVLDPFLGTGTTTLAGIVAGRNSIGIELDETLPAGIFDNPEKIKSQSNQRTLQRIKEHTRFMETYTARKGPPKYRNSPHNFPVITRQEIDLQLHSVSEIAKTGERSARVSYTPLGPFNCPEDITAAQSAERQNTQPELF